MKLSDQFRSIN